MKAGTEMGSGMEADDEPEILGNGLPVKYELLLDSFSLCPSTKLEVAEVFRAVKEAVEFFGYGLPRDRLMEAIELFGDGTGLGEKQCGYCLEFLVNIGVFKENAIGLDGYEYQEGCVVFDPECEFLVCTELVLET